MSITSPDPQVIAARFQAWVEERRADPSDRDLVDHVVTAGATAADAERLGLRSDAFLFAPEDVAVDLVEATRATVIPYSGEIASTGSEVGIGDDLVVQFESYSTVEYLALACPTAVTIRDAVDLDVLRADADSSVDSGQFPEHLLNPLVTFSSLAKILRWDPAPEYGRSRVSTVVREAFAAPEGRRLRRFLAAIRVLQLARSRVETGLSVSGFGGPFLATIASEADSNAPFVLRADDGRIFVSDARRCRFGAVPHGLAEIVEAVAAGAEPSAKVAAAAGITRWNDEVGEVLFRQLGLELPGREDSSVGT